MKTRLLWVVSTGLQVECAQRGYNPHHRKVPSYYPIAAYEAGSGQILRVRNRSGNVHDGKASIGFLRDLFAQIRATLAGSRVIEFRMDGAFFRRDVIDLLQTNRAEYAIKEVARSWTSERISGGGPPQTSIPRNPHAPGSRVREAQRP